MPANECLSTGNGKPANGNDPSGRDANGRFAPGNPGGPGNPFGRKVAALRMAIVEALSEEDVREIVGVLKEKAKAGSTAAIKLLFQYAIGKPSAENDPDRVYLDDQLLLEASRLSRAEERPSPVATRLGGPRLASGTFAGLPSTVPAGLVDHLALAGLGAEHVSILSGKPPTPNGEIGAAGGREKEKRR